MAAIVEDMSAVAAFDGHVARDGYAWWYLDAISDDTSLGVTLIAFIGSVFSPYYARARMRAPADPMDFCAINVALYRDHDKRWALTERGRRAVHRSTRTLSIGNSTLAWESDALVAHVDERAAPFPHKLRGNVRVHPLALTREPYGLDLQGAHLWHPIAPMARVEVAFEHPRLHWTGIGYVDANRGTAPLESAFTSWQWARIGARSGASRVIYDLQRRDASNHCLALAFDRMGRAEPIEPPPRFDLPATRWRVKRHMRAEPHEATCALGTLEDTPFYARTMLSSRLDGTAVAGMHESLSLDRFRSPWVQRMLPFRMRRLAT